MAQMVTAYILVQTDMDKSAEVAEAIGALDGVVHADVVTGPYDVIVRAQAETMDDLGKLVIGRMQMIAGITRRLRATHEPEATSMSPPPKTSDRAGQGGRTLRLDLIRT